MKCLFAGELAVALVAQVSSAQAPAPKVIPNEPTCPKCTIGVQNLVMLGTEDGAGTLNGKPMSVNVDSRGRYWVFEELEPPTVFSATGGVSQTVGRKGRGPGEFQAANNGIVVGDSMLVFDWMERRATMVGPDLKSARTIPTGYGVSEVLVLAWPTLLVTASHREGSDPPNSSMHRFSLAGPDMQILGSFGPRGTGGSMGNVDVQQLIGRASDGIWSAYWNRPQFTRWDRNGVTRLTLTRSFNWYTPEMKGSMGTPTTPPRPRTAAIHEDAEGLVWLFIHTPAPTWKEGWEARPIRYPGGGSEYPMRAMGWDKLFRTYVEVIDPVQARVVSSTTINGYVFQALPDRRAALYQVDFSGIPRVQIVQLSLTGR
jgi:hypothetical protein